MKAKNRREHFSSSEARQQASVKQKEYLERNPDAVEAMSGYAKSFWNDDKFIDKREKKIAQLREYWTNEGNRDAQRMRRIKFLEDHPNFTKEVSLRGKDHPHYGQKRDRASVEKSAAAVRGSKRTKEAREKMASQKRGKYTPRSPEAIERRIAGVKENSWKSKITRPLNAQYRNKILPIVYCQIIVHEMVQDKFKTFKIVDLEKEAFRSEKGRSDRLVICLKGNIIFKFLIG